jgi:hypothetical protein
MMRHFSFAGTVWGLIGLVLLALFARNYQALEGKLVLWLAAPIVAACPTVEVPGKKR